MATKKDPANKKAPAAPAAPQAGAAAAKPAAPREPQSAAPQSAAPREPQSAAPRAPQAAPALENKGSSRGTTSRRSSDEIARRAYELWQQRGAPHGSDQEDWHAAERELDGGTRH